MYKRLFIVTGFVLLAAGCGSVTNQTEKVSPSVTPAVSVTAVPQTNNNKLDLSGQGLIKAPAYIFEQTNLQELNLSNNKITGALQAEVRHLQNLKVLNLSNNNFSGVPAEIGQLKNLEVLNLSNNELTGLPNELGNLTKLKLLDLSGNNYSKQDLENIKNNLPKSTVIKID